MKKVVVIQNIGIKGHQRALWVSSSFLDDSKHKPWKARWRCTLGVIGVIIFGAWLLTSTRILFNASPSLPYRFFFCMNGTSYSRGDVVHVQGHTTPYTKDISLTKRVLGVPGDPVKSLGPLQSHTQDGKLLTPLQKQVIPQGYVFLGADHPRSFDSRYTEFGLVPMRRIQGRCVGLMRRTTL